MAIESKQTQLERVQAAIAAIESGAQEYRDGDFFVKRADYKTLVEREKNLLGDYNRETRGTGIIHIDVSGGL